MNKGITRDTGTTRDSVKKTKEGRDDSQPCVDGSCDLRALVSPIQPQYPDSDPFPTDDPWIWINSRLLGEKILLVLQLDQTRQAIETYPEAVVYVVPEMEILSRFADRPATIRELHRIKKEMDGWLVWPREAECVLEGELSELQAAQEEAV